MRQAPLPQMPLTWLLSLSLIGAACSRSPTPAPPDTVTAAPVPVPMPPPAPTGIPSACTRTLPAEPPRSREPYISTAVWLDAQQIAVFLEHVGLVVHDAATGKRTRAFSDSSAEWEVEWAALRPGSTTELLLAGKKLGVATLDLETGCLRAPGTVRVWNAAIDAAGGRFFVTSEGKLTRVDATTLTKFAVVAPESSAVAYEPLTRTVLTRVGLAVRFHDPETLAALGSLDLVRDIIGGPWARPGHAEVAFTYETPCEQWEEPGGKSPRCLRGHEWGLVLVDVARRAEVARLPAPGWIGLRRDDGTWSRDGSVFTLQGAFKAATWRPAEKHAAVHALPHWEFPQIFFGPDAESYLAKRSGGIQIQLRSPSGATVWSALLPYVYDP